MQVIFLIRQDDRKSLRMKSTTKQEQLNPQNVCGSLPRGVHNRRTEGTKKYVFNAFEQREKEARSLFAAQYLIYLFVSRHEVHSMNTHTLQNAG